ncbi:hypothetical protein M434DRAFT_213158 [Hypoxylon sp. CO27-5]|nr:hypothetical protein M434DRAFT_213158 [Hypoxylon sp. CO27-5]
MSVNDSTPTNEASPETSSRNSNTPRLATTNYGNQVAFNYGSISSFFVLEDVIHPCVFPIDSSSITKQTSHLYTKIETARVYHKSKRYVEARVILSEVLRSSALPTDARLAAKYDLASAHFAVSEFSEAAEHFEYVAKTHTGQERTVGSTLSDSEYWLARSFFNLEKYDDASYYLQRFVLRQDENDSQQLTKGILWLGLTLERLGLYKMAKQQMKRAVTMCVETFGPEHLETLASQHHLANFLYKRKAFYEAYQLFRRVLEAEERLSGPEKTEAIKTRCMLALCLAQLGRYGDAEPHLQRVFSRMNSDPNFISNEVGEPGLVYYWLGRLTLERRNEDLLDKAGSLFHRALTDLASKKDLEAEFTDCQRYLARTMTYQRQFAGAEHTLREIIPIIEGTQQGDLIASYYGLAANLIAQNKTLEAKATLERIVSVETPIQHCIHTGEDLAACLHLLGQVYYDLGQFHHARDCFQRVVDVPTIVPNHCHNSSLYWLGNALFELQKFEDARKHFTKAYEVDRQHLRSEKGHIVQVPLGWTLCCLELFDEAESNLTPIHTFFSQRDTKPSPMSDFLLGRSRYYLGRVAIHRKNWPEAIELLQSALPMLTRRFGLNHHSYIECRYHLAHSHVRIGECNEARLMFQELLNGECQHIGIQNIRSILVPYWLSHVSSYQRNYEDATMYARKALDAWGNESSYQGVLRREAQITLAQCLERAEELEEWSQLIKQAIKDEPSDIDKGGEWYASSRQMFARSLYCNKRYDEACETFKLVIPVLEALYSYDHLHCSLSRAYLADCLGELGRSSEAELLVIHAAEYQVRGPGTSRNLIKAIGNYWLGRRAFDRRQFEEAEDRFQTARNLWGLVRGKMWESKIFECRHFLSRIHYEEMRYDDAQALFGELAEQQYKAGYLSEAVDSQYYLGLSLRRSNAAKDAFQKIINDKQGGKLVKSAIPESYYCVGRLLFLERDLKPTKECFELALEGTLPLIQKAKARFFLARTLYLLEMYDEAIAQFQSTIELKPADRAWTRDCRYWSGRSHIALKKWPDAKTHLQLSYYSKGKEWQYESDCRYFLGQALFAIQDYAGAKSHFQALHNTPGNLSKMPLGSDYYLGCCLLELGEFELSRTILTVRLAKLRKHTNDKLGEMTTRFQLARCLHRLNISHEAENEFETIHSFFESRSSDGDPTVVQIEYELGLIAKENLQWERATDFFKIALVKHERIPEHSILDVLACKHHLGNTFFTLRRYEEALYLFQQVLEGRKECIKPPHRDLIDAQRDVGRTLCELENYARAEPLVREALEWEEQISGPEDLLCLPTRLLLGEIMSGLSNFEQAVELFSKAVP